jgi:antitoxin VapB
MRLTCPSFAPRFEYTIGIYKVDGVSKARTKVFKSNKSQAVRLPKPVALPDAIVEVEIVAVGNTRIITPAGRSWDDWFDGPGVSSDFMAPREQPADQGREPL